MKRKAVGAGFPANTAVCCPTTTCKQSTRTEKDEEANTQNSALPIWFAASLVSSSPRKPGCGDCQVLTKRFFSVEPARNAPPTTASSSVSQTDTIDWLWCDVCANAPNRTVKYV